MVDQDLHDDDDYFPDSVMAPIVPKPYGKGNISEDALEPGQFVCVISLKQSEDGAPIMGQSLEIKAVCLPFFVARLLSDPAQPTLTLDCRYLNLMRVTKEFVDAQREGVKLQMEQMMTQPKRKRKQQEEGP